MAKKVYIGVDDVARKVKKMYLGVDGKARKIKKGYIGIGGVARPFWTGGELAYYGTITALSVARENLSATSVGDYALFGGGGYSDTTAKTTVDAYNKSLTRSTPTALSLARYCIGAASVGNYALFAGGQTSNNPSADVNTINVYDKSLTMSTKSLPYNLKAHTATSFGGYALFAGGTTNGDYVKNYVHAYNGSLTVTTINGLSMARKALAATTVGDYAVFGGGFSTNLKAYNYVDACDKSLTFSSITNLSVARGYLAASSVGDYALFAGGTSSVGSSYDSSNVYATIDAYNKSLTRSTPTPLSQYRHNFTSTTLGDYALFAGGSSGDLSYSSYSSVITDAYDKSLTRTVPTGLNNARARLASTTVGDYALFGGGCRSISNEKSTVDCYVIT